MPISVAHDTAADGTFSAAGVTAWDAAHSLVGFGTGVEIALAVNVGSAGAFVTFNGALGTPSSGTLTNATGLPEGGLSLTDLTTNDFGITQHGFVPKGTNVGNFLKDDGTWAAPTASATLNGISAATADQAGIANADWNIRWNWAKTTNSEVAFEIGESAASTGGTSTSGIPNQVIAKFSTAALSTASPLQAYSRAVHVFSVSPTTAQIFAAPGSSQVPPYSFAAGTASGIGVGPSNQGVMFYGPQGGNGSFFDDGTDIQMRIYGTGNFVRPTFTDSSNATSGMVVIGNPATVGVAIGSIENSRFIGAQGASIFQLSNAGAVTTGYAVNFRKSRGTVAAPTVITTGDDLATITGAGYVGATGTYVEACRITFDSTGTIANTTSGVGGIARMEVAAVGAVGPVEVMRWQRATTTGGGWATMNEADASPATTDLADGDEAAIYVKAGNLVIAQNVGGAMKFLFIPIDGTTTTWTADGTGP